MAVQPTGGRPGTGPGRAELLAALSLAIDLGLGRPMEHMLRSSLIAARLADRLGLGEQQRGVVFYANLVAWIGCHADSHEVAGWFGDDIAFRADSYRVDWAGSPLLGLLRARRASPAAAGRGGRAVSFPVAPRGRLSELIHSHCASAGVLADRVGLAAEVREALAYFFERWDGGGLPVGAQGDAIPVEMRVVQLADVAEVHLRLAGVDGAVAMARSRSGTQFDPAIAATFGRCAGEILDGLPDDVWRAALAQAPDRDRLLTEGELDGLLEAMGDFVDLKCPFTLGHSRGVAALAAEAGQRCGLPGADVKLLRRAGLVHDLGRMGVSNAIWEKPGPLSAGEWERVRLHPYLTGRILSRVRGLEPVATLAAAHHERQDGSGYPRAGGGGAPPGRAERGRGRRAAASPGTGVAAGCPGRRCGAGGRRASGTSAQGLAGRAHHPGGRGAAPGRPGPVQPWHRRRPVHQREDRPQPRRAHLQQARRVQPDRRQPVRRRARHRRQLPEPDSGKMGQPPHALTGRCPPSSTDTALVMEVIGCATAYDRATSPGRRSGSLGCRGDRWPLRRLRVVGLPFATATTSHCATIRQRGGTAMPETTDPTFYRTPGEAIAAPPERLAYVAAFDPAGKAKDAIAVLDC